MKAEDGFKTELLTFRLKEQEYALDIKAVREIRGWSKATPLPHSPKCMKGVINLRGTVLPVMDLAIRLGLSAQAYTTRNVIIVVEHAGKMTGLLVDAVSDIISLTATDQHLPPSISSQDIAPVIESLTLFEGRMIRILDLAGVISISENVAA